MVVRFEVDACLPSDEKNAELDSMTRSLATLNVASESSWSQGLHIIHAGSEVPQQSLVELKTTGSRKSVKWSEVFPQLYLSQTPWFYIGYHENGTFSELQIHKTVEMEAQRDFFEPRLRKLGQMLKTIQELVVAHGTKTRLSLVCQGGVLSLYERVTRENCLPAEELARPDVD
ncbi:hypothetical protein EWM64_g2374 [Hericium alpestre]|uniref:Uncharacterized protein n=1 Tax=Hericium alpestre TaxID=135208 RepID=A0A4Z0A7M8_9AGAM|nr:hypothetical protein EWM64_g2374 [Hericium alpestre]